MLVGLLVCWLVGWSVGDMVLNYRSLARCSPTSGGFSLRPWIDLFFAQVMGAITGSDTRADRTLSRSLSVFGMQVCPCVYLSVSYS